MLNTTINFKRHYRVVVYLRMSSDKQNPRSPDQQLEAIKRRLRSLGYNWTIVQVYRDDAISGRYVRKRPQFQKMLHDLKSGMVAADFILVDTLERFGRFEEIPSLRRDLHKNCGVLVLTADSDFADPNTPSGRALGRAESERATEHNRIKAHDVLRGKQDGVLLKHWPGGQPPFGFMLQTVMKYVNGRQEVDYSILVPNPREQWIIVLLFTKAEQTNWGTPRLAEFLKNHSDIPADLKPFLPTTVGRWLDDPVYIGTYVYCERSTDLIDDRRVSWRNPEAEVIRVSDFCQPLVTQELWAKVQAMRERRRLRYPGRKRQGLPDGKLIAPLAPGMAINYLLSGLLRCGLCGRSMTISSSPEYITAAGESRRYISYICPGHAGNICENDVRVPEKWIREQVISTIRSWLFPRPE